MSGNNERPTPEWIDVLETNQLGDEPLLTLAAGLRDARTASTAPDIEFRESLRTRLARQHARQRSPLSWLWRPAAGWAAAGAAAAAVVLLVLVVGGVPTGGAVQTGQAVTVEPTATAEAASGEQEQALRNLLTTLQSEDVWIESVSPEPGAIITETTNVQVAVGYNFDEPVEGLRLILELHPVSDGSWTMPGSFSQSQPLATRSGTVDFDFVLNPVSAEIGSWQLSVLIGTEMLRNALLPTAERFTPMWCINCLPEGETVAILDSNLTGSAARQQLVLQGSTIAISGTCIQTQLLVDDAPADWWPTNRCASTTKDGRWRLNVPLYGDDVPQPLPTDVTYVAEAWLEGEREEAASRDVSATLAEVVEQEAQIAIDYTQQPQGVMRVVVQGSSTLPDGTCLNTQLLINGKAIADWPSTRCVVVERGRWKTTVPTSQYFIDPEVFEQDVELNLSAQVWPEGEPASAVERHIQTMLIPSYHGGTVSIGRIEAPVVLEILSTTPERATAITETIQIEVKLSYSQTELVDNAMLFVELKPVDPSRYLDDGQAATWLGFDEMELLDVVPLEQMQDTTTVRFDVEPNRLQAGDWYVSVNLVGAATLNYKHRFGQYTWCIDCDSRPPFTLVEYYYYPALSDHRHLAFAGRTELPDGTCIFTELRVDGDLVDWWPQRECAPVQGSQWEIMTPFDDSELLNSLPAKAIYEVRAWREGDEANAVMQTFAPPGVTSDPNLKQ